MKLNLLSINSQRPDKRAIARLIAEIGNLDDSLANELTEILLEGDPVDIEVDDNNAGSSKRLLRKLDIDYEIID